MAEAEKEQAQAAEAADESLLGSILQETLKMKPAGEDFEVARKGMAAFIAEMMTPERKGERVQQKLVDEMIAEIDQKMSRQLDQIMHNPAFQKMESAWRGLRFVIDRTDFRENIKIDLINVSKEDLLNDFVDSPEVPKSGLYKLVYTREYGTFGGNPVGAMIANYEFGPGSQDVALLQYAA